MILNLNLVEIWSSASSFSINLFHNFGAEIPGRSSRVNMSIELDSPVAETRSKVRPSLFVQSY